MSSGDEETGETTLIFDVATGRSEMISRIVQSNREWKAILPPETYRVARLKDTEPPFSGPLWDCHRDGIYRCACCATDLFDSINKFDTGTGWPSFREAVSPLNIETVPDYSLGMIRTEVLCRRCGAHLGHLFDDGPPPTGLRYCMNSWALVFVERPG
jgi:peptide-methionine (R)-S-oxide reductase